MSAPLVVLLLVLCLLVRDAAAFAPAAPASAARLLQPQWRQLSSYHQSTTALCMARMGLNKEPLELCDENAVAVIEEIRQELGTIFGYDAGSRQAGITGTIELVEVDGPTMVVSLAGRFWHATDTVMLRVESYIRQRIPEVIEVKLDTSKSTIIDDNRLNTDGGKKLF